jgi:Zn-dependent peptidase ImmA (M78 family)
MPFQPRTLNYILEARGASLCSALKISADRFQEALAGDRIPTKNQIFGIAELLAVPAYAFFLEEFEFRKPELVDYRKRKPTIFKTGINSAKFEQIIRLRDFLSDLYVRLDIDAPQKLFSEQPNENPEQFAATIANLLGIEKIRNESKNNKEFYRLLRDRIEDLGVFVIQDHHIPTEIDGLAIYHGNFTSNLIGVNSSRRNHGAKTFTLAHELAHILGKRSAVTDNYKYNNEIETFCNRFAASLLMPRSSFLEAVRLRNLTFRTYEDAIDSSKALATLFKTSVSAALVRAIEFKYADASFYKTFASGFGTPDFLDTIKPQGGGSNPDGPEPGIVDLAMYGKRAVAVITTALTDNKTSAFEVFKQTGLSRKRILGLQAIAEKNFLKVSEGVA